MVIDAEPEVFAAVAETYMQIGWENCLAAIDEAGRDTAAYAGERGFWRHPWHAELEALRQPPTTPCSARCGRCSRCVHVAYRGRRDAS